MRICEWASVSPCESRQFAGRPSGMKPKAQVDTLENPRALKFCLFILVLFVLLVLLLEIQKSHKRNYFLYT